MTDLTITQLKPNPLGKDLVGKFASNTQLVGEWVDIKNTSGKNLNMTGVKVYDHTFTGACGDEGARVVYTFATMTLLAGYTVRIHSGSWVPESSLSLLDRAGADLHLYTGYSYVWNNVCGDTAEVRNAVGVYVDWASYFSNPREGKILKRQGRLLV